MLSVRNAILAAALLLVLAILTSIIGMLQTPDSGGMGHDSYGTRGGGYRALYEVLDELEVDVLRGLSPPDADQLTAPTLVLLGPDPQIVGYEPAYLKSLLPWVQQGGRIVVAPATRDWSPFMLNQDTEFPDLLEVLELDDIEVTTVGSAPQPRRRRPSRPPSAEEIAAEIMEGLSGDPPPLSDVPVELSDSLEALAGEVDHLTISKDSLATLLIGGTDEPHGTIDWIDKSGFRHTLVARFPRGRGEIVVVSDPKLLANRRLARADNSVLAVRLLSPEGGAVQFDEFYHGLGVRGSPLYLLTRLPYATVTLGLLLLLGVWTWRKGIFLGPPLPDVQASRRDISEYIDAMGRFFASDERSHDRLLRQVRDGVLRQISEEVGLPPDTADVDRVAATVGRQDVRRGEMLLEATGTVDQQLQSRSHWSDTQTLHAMQRMTDCLSTNSTEPSAENWKRSSLVRTK